MKKLIDKDPFSNGFEYILFESNNCDLCIKSSEPRDGGDGLLKYINEREDGLPKCSIQRDIVTRMYCNEPIKQETVDICNNYILHGTLCPYRKTQRKHQPKKIKEQLTLEL